MYWLIKIGLRKWNFFDAKEFFYMIFDFKNGCKNEFKDNNEKSCSWSRKRVSRKIDFKVQWLRNSHADSVGVNKKIRQSIYGVSEKRRLSTFKCSPTIFEELNFPQETIRSSESCIKSAICGLKIVGFKNCPAHLKSQSDHKWKRFGTRSMADSIEF